MTKEVYRRGLGEFAPTSCIVILSGAAFFSGAKNLLVRFSLGVTLWLK